jgi:hypothetical protein
VRESSRHRESGAVVRSWSEQPREERQRGRSFARTTRAGHPREDSTVAACRTLAASTSLRSCRFTAPTPSCQPSMLGS